jgi:phosphoglycolate phosphatase
MSRFSAVIFDLDGTLTDPGSGIAATIRGVLMTLGVRAPSRAELRWCVGPPLREIFTRLLEPLKEGAPRTPAGKNELMGREAAGKGDPAAEGAAMGELVDRAAALYIEQYAQTGAAESAVYPGVEKMLTELRAALRLFVATSKNTATAERILGLCGLRRYFDDVAGNGRLNDKGDTVRELIDREHLGRAGVAIAGDREHDITAGKRNGIFTVGVTYGYGSREELAAAGADRICESPAEVARFLLAE